MLTVIRSQNVVLLNEKGVKGLPKKICQKTAQFFGYRS
jgi:hypothetical protein